MDYLVEWEEEYVGQWGKNKKQWVRDIDILTPQAIEQYKRSENDENKSQLQSENEHKSQSQIDDDKDDRYESDERSEEENYEENEIHHTQEQRQLQPQQNSKEQRQQLASEDNLKQENDDEKEEEIRAFLGKIENDKLTDRNIRDRPDYDQFVAAKQEEIDNAFATGTFVSVKKEDIPKNTKINNMMWVHKIKPETKLEKQRYRSRLYVY